MRIVVGLLLGGYLCLLALAHVPALQRALTAELEATATELLQTQVELGSVELGLMNRVVMRDVVLHDRQGREMLRCGTATCKVEWLPLFKGLVSLRSVSLLDAKVELCQQSADSDPNFAFLLKLFAQEEKKEKDTHLHINSLILRRVDVNYNEDFHPETPGHFNTSHIGVRGLNANVSLRHFTPDSLNLRVRSLSFSERSGFVLDNLRLRLTAGKEKFELTDFELRLPDSHWTQENLTAHYHATTAKHPSRLTIAPTSIDDIRISTNDLAPFVPLLNGLDQRLSIRTNLRAKNGHLTFDNLRLRNDDGGLDLLADVAARVRNDRFAGIRGDVARLAVPHSIIKKLVENATQKPAPKILEGVNNIAFHGTIDYDKAEGANMAGRLSTQSGQLDLTAHYGEKKLTATVTSPDLSPATLAGDERLPEKVAFTADASADFNGEHHPTAQLALAIAELHYKETRCKDLKLDAKWRNRRLDATLSAADPALLADVQARSGFDGKKFWALALAADVKRCNLSQLKLTEHYGNTDFSGKITADVKNFKQPTAEGNIRLTDFKMKRAEGNDYALNELLLALAPVEQGSHVKLRSDFATADLIGELSTAALADYGKQVINRHLPGILTSSKKAHKGWELRATLHKTDFFHELLALDLDTDGPLKVEGELYPQGDRLNFSAYCDAIDYNNTRIDNVRVHLHGYPENLTGRIQAKKRMAASDVALELILNAASGKLNTELLWDDQAQHKFNGKLFAITRTEKSEEAAQPYFVTEMQPTAVMINDTVWHVKSGRFKYGHGGLDIHDFLLSNEAANSLSAHGRIAKNSADSLIVNLHRINVAYVLNLINFNAVEFSGAASGRARLKGFSEGFDAKVRLDVEDFRFNQAKMGRGDIKGSWNNDKKCIELDAVLKEREGYQTTVKGYVSPPNKNLDLHIVSQNTDLYFLNKYVAGIFDNVQGRVNGELRLFGPFKELDFIGKERADVSAKLVSTNVEYNLTGGEVTVTPGCFAMEGFTIHDREDNRGTASGSLRHEHLKDLRYDFDVTADRMLVYDRPKEIDMPFYATVYGTGDVKLKGYPGNLTADIDFQPTNKTQFVYTLDSPEDVGEVQFLTFRDKSLLETETATATNTNTTVTTNNAQPQEIASTDIKLNFHLQITPEAQLKIIMDERAGDNITVRGNASMNASWYNKGNFTMNGSYTVEDGIYKLSLQDIIRKDFRLQSGSKVNFTGDPYYGDLDIRAKYTVNSASVSDLNIGNSFRQGSTRADCILNVNGKVYSPEVSFDLELPDMNADEAQMVYNLLSTEEDMNMQILYLLGVGRFYTYDYGNMEQSSRQSQSSVAMKSFLSNTLSTQLNDIISNAIGSSNWNFGTNLSTGTIGWSDMEIEGLLSGRLLNNRLLVNGNFGYRDRPMMNTNFVGDFDVNYLITPSGSVSLKAYSETNDRYFSKSALTTQGVGIQLKRDFFNLKDLFTTRKQKK